MPSSHAQKSHYATSAPAIKPAANAGNNTFTTDAPTLNKLIDGGAGFDTLELTSSSFSGNAANLRSIERIVHDGSGTLTVSAANLIANGAPVVAISSAADFDPLRAVAVQNDAQLTAWHGGHVSAADLQGDARFAAILAADRADGQATDYLAFSLPAVSVCQGGHPEIILLVNTAVPVILA